MFVIIIINHEKYEFHSMFVIKLTDLKSICWFMLKLNYIYHEGNRCFYRLYSTQTNEVNIKYVLIIYSPFRWKEVITLSTT